MSKLSKTIIKTMWLITVLVVSAFVISINVSTVVTTWKWFSVVAICCCVSFYGTILLIIIDSIRNNRKDNKDENTK